MRSAAIWFSVVAVVVTGCNRGPATCSADRECDGSICDFGTCRAVACNADSDCPGRACLDGACTAPPSSFDDTCPLPASKPASGATDIDVLTDVRVTAPTGVDPATLSLTLQAQQMMPKGAVGYRDVPVVIVYDGADAVAVPLAPLDPDTTYSVGVALDCGSRTFSFTTEHADVVDGASFAPRTVLWDLAHVEAVPPSASGMLGMIVTGPGLLQLADNHAQLDFLDVNEAQRTCDPTLDLAGTGDNPRYAFSGDVPALSLQNGGLRETSVRGIARGDDTDLAGLIVLDARRIAFHLNSACVPGDASFPACAQAVCAYGATMGLACSACDDGEPFCATAEIRGGATPTTDTAAHQTLADVCARTECASKPICQ